METGCTCCSAICSSQRSIVSPCASACALSAAAFSSESSMVTFIPRILLSLQDKDIGRFVIGFPDANRAGGATRPVKRSCCASSISFWPALSPAQRFAAERALQIGDFDHLRLRILDAHEVVHDGC